MIKSSLSYRGIVTWLICSLFFMYEFLLRTVLGIYQQPISLELNLTPFSFAILSSSVYQLVYSFMQIPVGLLLLRFSFKKTLLLAILICVIANIGLSLASSFHAALLFRTLMGLGSSFGFICLLVAAYHYLPRKNIALYIGLSQFIGTLGPILAAGPLHLLSQTSFLHWRNLLIYLAGLGCILALLVLIIIKEKSETKVLNLNSNVPFRFSHLKKFLCQKQVWFIAIFTSFIYFSLEYLSENECKYFLVNKGFSENFSTFMISLCWLSYAIGCPLLGFISDKLKRRKNIIVLSASLALIALFSIIYLSLNETILAFCFAMLGLGASGQSIGFVIMAEQCNENHLGLGLGFNNAMIGFFAAGLAPLISFILEKSPALLNYQIAFSLMVIALIIALILAQFFIKETYKPQINHQL